MKEIMYEDTNHDEVPDSRRDERHLMGEDVAAIWGVFEA